MAPRIAAITATSVIIADLVAPGTASEFHFVWLRDNCPCARCLHPTNRQKLHNSFQVPTDIAPVSVAIDGAALVLEWDRDLEPLHLDGETPKSRLATPHRTELPLERLIAGAYLTTKQGPAGTVALPSSHARVPFPPVVWDRPLLEKSPDLFVDFADICPSNHPSPAFETIEPGLDRGLYRFLKQLSDYGLCIVRGVPASTGNKLGIEAVAERIGPILETFYGRTWDVKSIERSNNIAYTNVELGLHTDLCYMEKPPGLQFLHCLIQSPQGGESYFSDAYRAVERLAKSTTLGERDLDILARIPVTFHYDSPVSTHRLKYTHPTIRKSADLLNNEAYEVTYSPPFQGPMEFAQIQSSEDVIKFYSAFKKFARVLEEEGASWEYLMKPGDMVVFSNRRVLHARKAFSTAADEGKKVVKDGKEGEEVVTRHLKGTYLQWDCFRDRLRGLEAVYGKQSGKL